MRSLEGGTEHYSTGTGSYRHVETLAKALAPHCKHVVTLVGSEPAKEKLRRMEYLQNVNPQSHLLLRQPESTLAKDFDPRRGHLFLAFCPFPGKGSVAHAIAPGYTVRRKSRIYDYIDIPTAMCDVIV